MADFGQFEADTTQNDYDNDFERLDANDSDKVLAGENPEEDLYSADPQPPSQPSIPEGDLLGGFGMGEAPQSEPLAPDMGGFDAGFGASIPEADPEPAFAPDTTSTEPEGDMFGIGMTKPSSQLEPEEPSAPEAASQPDPEPEQKAAPLSQDSSDTTPALGN